MNLFDASFWMFVTTTGRVPRVPDHQRIGDRSTPVGLKSMSTIVTVPGNEAVDPADIVAKILANQLRSDARIFNGPNLQPFDLASDAMIVPNTAIMPSEQAMHSLLRGGDGIQ